MAIETVCTIFGYGPLSFLSPLTMFFSMIAKGEVVYFEMIPYSFPYSQLS